MFNLFRKTISYKNAVSILKEVVDRPNIYLVYFEMNGEKLRRGNKFSGKINRL